MKRFLLMIVVATTVVVLQSCLKSDDMWASIDDLKAKITALESKVGNLNSNTLALYRLKKDDVVICGVKKTSTGYELEFSDGKSVPIVLGDEMPTLVPIIGIDAKGYWTYSLDNGTTFKQLLVDDKPVSAYPKYDDEHQAFPPKIKVDANGYWLVSYDDGVTYTQILDRDKKPIIASGDKVTYSGFFESVILDNEKKYLNIKLKDGSEVKLLVKDNFGLWIGAPDPDTFMAGETRFYEVVQTNVAQAMIFAPEGWKVELKEDQLLVKSPDIVSEATTESIAVAVTSPDGFIRTVKINAILTTMQYDSNAAEAWNRFKASSADNVLLDFSYAGYKNGETSIPDIYSHKLKIFNMKEYGAIPDDNISDRDAFKLAVKAATTAGGGIIYFPRGRYILHDETDNVPITGNQVGVNGKVSETMHILSDNIFIKGDSRDESIIAMESPMLPTDPAILYSSPTLIQFKHNTGVVYGSTLATVNGDSPAGSFKVKVAGSSSIAVGSWVCLRLMNNDAALINGELGGRTPNAAWTNLAAGVNVETFHRVKSKTATEITLYEPLLYPIESKYNWTVHEYRNYTNCGVEDICFEGKAKPDYVHHGSWEDNGAYKPIDFMRLTNSYIRRVKYKGVSEATSIALCANVTVADVIIEGNRGHSAIRAQGSSRTFIGKVLDSSGNGKGQDHACGVSKTSMGTVIWGVDWGTESTFESHATQPRATLIDNCTGGFLNYHAGGDISQLPNHLGNLTIWNLNSKTNPTTFDLWAQGGYYVQPIIVGLVNAGATPFASQEANMKYSESLTSLVNPVSLYEAQLRLRLGYVPAWLNAIKAK